MCSTGAKLVKQEASSDSVTEMQVSRRREPEHFLLKVESFSELKLEKYESDIFEAGGCKWRLILYPNGDKARNGSNHISLYLCIIDTQNLPSGWAVEGDFSLFVYNSLSEKYLTFKLAEKTRFNWLKTESGFAQLMPLDEFKEASNGYLFGDACVFGAEIYVTGSSVAKRQTLTKIEETFSNTNTNIFTWTVLNFSKLNDARRTSENFIIGGVQWNLELYPKGTGDVKGKSISFFLAVADDELKKFTDKRKVNAEYTLRIRNQLNTNNHANVPYTNMFSYSATIFGDENFLWLSTVDDKSEGYLNNDCLVVEVEFTKVEIIHNFK